MSDNLSVTHTYEGTTYRLAFTWDVWEAFLAEWGDEHWQQRLNALFQGNPKDLVFIATQLTDGEFDRSVTIPFSPFVNAIYRAYELAWNGIDVGEPKSAPEAKADGKKRKALWRFWLIKGRSGSA